MKVFESTTKESEKDGAQTPWWFIRSLESVLGIKFSLDVCCSKLTAKAGNYFSLVDDCKDGLSEEWVEYNWCNPPFSDIAIWISKAIDEAKLGRCTAMIMPDNTETKYVRLATDYCDTIIRMPFRLNFLKPDGSNFLDKKGKKQGPQFPCAVFWFTPLGLSCDSRVIYHDFRVGFE